MSDPHRSVRPAIAGLVLASGMIAPASNANPRWEDEAIFRVNKEAPHATKMPFASAEAATTKERMESAWCKLLNGDWKFHWSPTFEQHEASISDFYGTDFDDSEWGTIPVPANVEMEGYGTPLYRSAGYLFPTDLPTVRNEAPEDWTVHEEQSPISAYRRSFTIPESWKGRNTFIVFNGVDSAFTLYVNGQEVGYSQDSRTPAEFNLTKYLKPGENVLAVEVYRWSDGSYLEDQDMWRLSGIFRDVYLWSAANVDLRDVEIHASLDDEYAHGVLNVSTFVCNYATDVVDFSVEAVLLDESGKPVVERQFSGEAILDADAENTIHVEGLQIEPWSAERPQLYTLQLALKNAAGEEIAFYAFKVGFMRTEVKNGRFLVNGKPILIKGVNRHDHDDQTGHYVSEETMRAELDLMKQLNINAIRTSHYPNDPRFLELVSEYGFYVISESNVETHGFGVNPRNTIANDVAWRPALLDRVINMVETFKNQPCIIAYSLGNEAGTGPNFVAMADWIHQRDASRPVHYEGARDVNYDYVDFVSPMYYNIGSLNNWCRRMEQQELAEQKPMIQCEYSHAMGNSCGGLAEYWALIRKEPLLQGGFIWDWRDQGFVATQPADPANPAAVTVLDKNEFVADDGSLIYYTYGGDYGDNPHSDNFCMNGVVGAGLKPNPHAVEVAYQYRSILTVGKDVKAQQPVVTVLNENFFVPLKNQPLIWSVLEDGKPIKSGTVMIDQLGPQETCTVTIPVDDVTVNQDAEYFLNVDYPQTTDTLWAKAGRIVARDQIALAWSAPAVEPYVAKGSSSAQMAETDEVITLSSGRIIATLSRKTGQLISYRLGDQEYLKTPLMMNFWRAPLDNDRGNDMVEKCAPWRTAGGAATVKTISTQQQADAYEVTVVYEVPVGETQARVVYTFYADGALQVALELNPQGDDLPVLPRVGFQCSIDSAFSGWSWYGRGPEENYSDRNTGTFVGAWDVEVNQAWFPYSEPQETANRTDVRHAAFSDGEHGIRIRPADDQLLEIGAYPFLQSDLEGVRHPADIPLRDAITVQITHRQMGVGGENSWGAWPRPDHMLKADGTYAYSFLIQPY